MADKTRCKGIKADGTECKAWAVEAAEFCKNHIAQAATAVEGAVADVAAKAEAVVQKVEHDVEACLEHFPFGIPADADSAGCAHGTWTR
jgi:hypothetical protein